VVDTSRVKRETLSLCISCCQEVGDPPRLNRLPNGLPCPSCRDRILASLPAPLPGPGSERYPRQAAVEEDVEEPAGTQAGNLFLLNFVDPDEPA
jgi:DNA-directed RNA polymerase subunit RPC12/RpoP